MKHNIAGQGGSPASSSKGESKDGAKRSFVSGSRREPPHVRQNRQIQLISHCLLDVCRILKQEGWVDVLADEFSDAAAASEERVGGA